MSNSLLERLSEFNDLVEDLIRENNALKLKISKMEGTFGQTVFGNTNKPKLTKREVENLRMMKRNTSLSNREIADIYDVNPATVSRIVRGIYH